MFDIFIKHFFCSTFERSKSGVSSVVVFMGGLVGKIAFTDPLDAEPTPWADADEACEFRKKQEHEKNALKTFFGVSQKKSITIKTSQMMQ